MKKIYVVTARKWGDNETHNYVVGVFLDMEVAKSVADSHCQYRGGKYSLVVEEGNEGEYNEDANHYVKEVYRAKGIGDK